MCKRTVRKKIGFSSLPSSRLKWLVPLLLISAASPARAQSLRDEAYLVAIQEGLDHVYRLEHDEAVLHFEKLGNRFPEHPGPPLAGAVTIWLKELFTRQELELDRFISPGYFTRPSKREMPEADQRAFFEGVARAQELAEQYLGEHPGDKDARYYLGAVEGTLGVFAFTIERSYTKALRHGKKAFQHQRAIIEDDPDFYDSYLTVGTYEYILGNLPWYIKWIAAIAGYRGSEERGFQYLVLAAEKSIFVANDARVLLMVLYVRERQYDYGLEVARQLHKRYPESFLLHLNQAQILERMDARRKAAETYVDVIRFAEERRRNYQKLPLETFRYTTGTKLLELGARDEALDLFEAATLDPETLPRERALSHLKAGQILDLMGKREEAIAHYREVQRLEDFESSHKLATRFIDKPHHE